MEAKIKAYQEDLDLFEDELEKYEYIVSLGKSQPPIDPVFQIDKYEIKGCQSTVWIVPSFKDGKLFFQSDSNTVIVKGLAAMVCAVFSGESPDEILRFDTARLEALGLEEIISPLRRNGVSSMVATIRHYAKESV